MSNDDLRRQAINSVANYLHYELIDKGLPENMMPFMKDQAEKLLDACDRAIANTVAYERFAVIAKS